MFAERIHCDRARKKIYLFIPLAVMTVITLLLIFFANGYGFQYLSHWKITVQNAQGIKPDLSNLEFYHMNSQVQLGNKSDCVKTKTDPPVTVCLYPVESDIYVSKYIKTYGKWEPYVTALFLDTLRADPTSVLLDLGTNIGYYSLMAAKAGHLVVCVEPNIESIVRLHQSVELEGLKGNVVVLKNAVADRRGVIDLNKNDKNQGDTRVKLETKGCQGNCSTLLKSIVLNDLTYLIYDLSIISTNWGKEIPNKTLYEKLSHFRKERDSYMSWRSETLELYRKPPSNVIIKIDTQGFEHLIFNNPDFFFDKNAVTHIFMEWVLMPEKQRFINKTLLEQKDPKVEDGVKVDTMIRFLSSRRFRPYSTTHPRLYEALNLSMWHLWPGDILWCHETQWLFMSKMVIKNLVV